MKFSHREEQRGDRLLDVLTDEANGLRITVSRLGAELVSLARRSDTGEWIGFLYRDNDLTAPSAGWANHATVMGYYLHRLKNGRSSYRGREIVGGTHGFLRLTNWHVDPDPTWSGSLTYRIRPEDYGPADYPLRVALELIYGLTEKGVTVRFHFRNQEPELTAHVAFGLHPGLAATSFQSFQFVMPPGRYRRYFAPENFLSGETEDIDFEGGELPFARERLPGSYIVQLADVPDREFIYRDPQSRRVVTLDLTGVPYITLWSDGGPFLCVEPCWGLTDRHEQRAFEDKDGIQQIAAGGELRAAFSMNPALIG